MGFRLEPERPTGPFASGDEVPTALVGDELRRMFDDLVSAPLPTALVELCDALEDAFRRGDLAAGCDRKKSA